MRILSNKMLHGLVGLLCLSILPQAKAQVIEAEKCQGGLDEQYLADMTMEERQQ